MLLMRVVLTLLFGLLPMLADPAAHAEPTLPYVHVDVANGKRVFIVNGRECAPASNGVPYDEIMRRLGESLVKGEKGQTAAVIVNEEVPLDVATLMKQVAQKVGFERVLLFAHGSGGTRMRELIDGAVFPVPGKESGLDLGERASSDAAVPTEEDIAVLRAMLQTSCHSPKHGRVVYDVPPARKKHHLPPEWNVSASLSEALSRRAQLTIRWPHETVCTATVVDSDRIAGLFANDKRIPPGWDAFYREFPGASGNIPHISLPAFTPSRDRAYVYTQSRCDALDCWAFYVELKKVNGTWRVTREKPASGV
jgi:hypothetical protein